MVGPVPPPLGGMSSVVRNLERSRLGARVGLEVFDDAKPTREGRSLAEAVLGQLRLFGAYLQRLWQGRPDVVHVHTCSGLVFWRDAALAALARGSGRKVVWHVHGGLFADFIGRQGILARPLLGSGLRLGARVLVLSASWRQRLATLVAGVRWEVVPNGVPLPSEAVDPASAGRCVFLFMGHLGPEKGCDDLVDAVALARARSFGGRLDLAGKELEPGQRRKLEMRIEERGCSDAVRLIGVISGEDKARTLDATHCLVLPSHAEALPMAVLEGMALGLPIIATRVGAIPEVIEDGREGLLIEAGDVPALADCLLRIDGDPKLRSRLGNAGRARIAESFSLETMAERVAGIYEELLEAAQ
jgi:glycosyltransferase involved in cell wall biosynthesis